MLDNFVTERPSSAGNHEPAIPLRTAVLCIDCEYIYTMNRKGCPVCASQRAEAVQTLWAAGHRSQEAIVGAILDARQAERE